MKKIYKILFVTLLLTSILLSLPLSTNARALLEEWQVGIHQDNTGASGDFTNVSQMERLNQMQAYVYPVNDYNTSSLEPLDYYLSYMPVFIPKYIVRRTVTTIPSEANLHYIANLFNYEGPDQVQTSSTFFAPIRFESNTSTDYVFEYYITTNGSTTLPTDSREYWHGTTYSYYNDTELYTQELHGFGITAGYVNVSNVVYIKGKLTYVVEMPEGNADRYMVVERNIDTYKFISSDQTLYIDYTLDNSLELDSAVSVMSKFEGEVLVRYGNNETTRVSYVEDLSLDFSNRVSYSDTNLAGFSGDEYVSISTAFNELYYNAMGDTPIEPVGTLSILDNGFYNVKEYAYVNVNVPQNVSWGGMFDWLFDSMGAFMGFEIAPGWSIGIVMTIIVGLAIAIWVLKVFLGG